MNSNIKITFKKVMKRYKSFESYVFSQEMY